MISDMHPNCICGNNKYKKILSGVYSDQSFDILQCNQCNLNRTWPILIDDQANNFYDDQEDFQDRLNQLELWRSFQQKIIKILKKYKIGGSLLDVGCNVGIFVNTAIKNGYNAFGVDLSTKAIAAGKQKFNLDDKLTNGTLNTMNFPDQQFDIITYLHVMEHISDLNQELMDIYNKLKPGGIVLIEVPNFNSIWRKVLKAKWYGLSPQQHLWQFTRDSLNNILINHQYTILEVNTRYNMYHQLNFNFKSLVKIALFGLAFIFKSSDDLIVIAQKNV